MRFWLLFLLVGSIWAAPSENHEENPTINGIPREHTNVLAKLAFAGEDEDDVHGTANKALESANTALEIYNKTLDTVIPWEIFHLVIDSLEKHQGRYSTVAGELVGDIKVFLMNSEDHYFHATQSIYNWCGQSIDLLGAYLELFNNYDKERSDAQKTLLLNLLEDGIKYMDEAIVMLNKSSMNFNQASGKLESLGNQLRLDFKEESKVYQEEVQKVRNGQWSAMTNPIVGLIITIVNEVKTIPELKAALKEVQDFYSGLQDKVKLAITTIEKAKVELKKEIIIINDMRSATVSTHRFVPISHLIRETFTKTVNNLTGQCRDYRKRHGKQTLQSVTLMQAVTPIQAVIPVQTENPVDQEQ